MIAAAYNLEAKANEIYGVVKGRYECVKNKVAATIRAVAAKPAPKVRGHIAASHICLVASASACLKQTTTLHQCLKPS